VSDDINEYSDDQLRKLREFLEPLLPQNIDNEHPPLQFVEGDIRRLVEH
jgi:hypothetical protein